MALSSHYNWANHVAISVVNYRFVMSEARRITWKWKPEEKQAWPKGEWTDEPDKIQWLSDTGLVCLIVRNQIMGSLCGYVGIDETHPLFGLQWDNNDLPFRLISLRWPITYSGFCQKGCPPDKGICHQPEPGEPDQVWWFGFAADCWTDVAPYLYDIMLSSSPRNEQSYSYLLSNGAGYRNVDAIAEEVEKLSVQLAALKVQFPCTLLEEKPQYSV